VRLALIVPGGFGGPDDVIPVLRVIATRRSPRRRRAHDEKPWARPRQAFARAHDVRWTVGAFERIYAGREAATAR
jgi:hypothetical protein